MATVRRSHADLRAVSLAGAVTGASSSTRATVFPSWSSSSNLCTRCLLSKVTTKARTPVTVATTSRTGPGRTSAGSGHRWCATGTATREPCRRPSLDCLTAATLRCSSLRPAARSRRSKVSSRLRGTRRFTPVAAAYSADKAAAIAASSNRPSSAARSAGTSPLMLLSVPTASERQPSRGQRSS